MSKIKGNYPQVRKLLIVKQILKWIEGQVSKETVVLHRWESIAGNLVLTTELKT